LLQPADFVQNPTVIARFIWRPNYVGLDCSWQWGQAMFSMMYKFEPKKEVYRKSRVTLYGRSTRNKTSRHLR